MKNYLDLTGKVAVVTGASSGLGRAYAKALAENGAKVAAMARRTERLEDLKKEIEAAGGECLPVTMDVTKESMVIDGVKKVVDHFGTIDILINNAGAIKVVPTVDLALADWQKVVDISLTGYFLMARECGKVMIKNNYGRVINTASMFGLIAGQHMPNLAYNATKGAVPNFTRSLAQEWAEYNITVNAIAPGMFPSEMMVMEDSTLALLKNRCPIGRPGNVEELLGQMLLFASEASSYTTGQTIAIDGGWTAV
ncbi:SDR family NAD(P)-dependent oxidoreductase [Enterococcus hirae]|jgi:gluconate 5-dehydrogenase|nr:SDR family NAD(P)-dependent oxidoreductase [Enterococcaceae bacterium]MCI1918822.1 SDR family NAD(P)-dependent oxidoreductase [Enterococcaceae bacterium]MDM8214022.1 SDR family NAD(P)-dependent oxidoreductase [Enterococcus hirae]